MSFPLPSADGYVFDFNGTLFWDSDENRRAWDSTSERIRGRALSDEEYSLLNGRTDGETIDYLAPHASKEEKDGLVLYKETLYRSFCIESGLTLSPGAERVLHALKERGLPMAIASSAPRINMDWYIPEYGLERFFDKGRIIAGRTDIPSKPDPAIFRLAMRAIGTDPERTVVFEDSASGVKGALAAGAMMVIRILEPGTPSIRDPRIVEISSFEELTAEGL